MGRLEEVKKSWNKRDWDSLLDRKDINWLIEQAEKVEGLEKRLKELAQSNYCIICGDNATEVRQGQFYCSDCCK